METKLNQLNHIYQELKESLKWKVSDKRILMTIASIYVINHKEFRVDRFRAIAEKIKDHASVFSSLRSQSRFTTAAMLDVNFEQPENKIQDLFNLYDLYRAEKFASGTYTYIAASILLTRAQANPEKTIQRAKELYNGMKKEHVFLTSSDDYPLATLLALEEASNVIERMEEFYVALNNEGLSKGNHLQFLSHILTLGSAADASTLINRTTAVADSLKLAGIKSKTIYYPIFGMLALLPHEKFAAEQIVSIYESLNQEKEFKWQKDMNFMLAASFFVHDELEHDGLAETSLTTILEAILQAQQAVMIATITAATAASSSSNGS
ncbi:DUF4003 family protein [Ornithinibacillus contaminans]|uniref:DUF4003 family protein n=1 Tax=Ornithinibacillus contaminans TaxID=694055 RepID=UPI00064DDB90|nr:DUF4003 family protein [Ornithinibacillus contaminans]